MLHAALFPSSKELLHFWLNVCCNHFAGFPTILARGIRNSPSSPISKNRTPLGDIRSKNPFGVMESFLKKLSKVKQHHQGQTCLSRTRSFSKRFFIIFWWSNEATGLIQKVLGWERWGFVDQERDFHEHLKRTNCSYSPPLFPFQTIFTQS